MINDSVEVIAGNVRAMLSGLVSQTSADEAEKIVRKIALDELKTAHLEEAQWWYHENPVGNQIHTNQEADRRIDAIKSGDSTI